MYLGAEFDTTDSGILDCSREGGHKHARVVHAHGDATGREIQRVLTNAVTGHDLVTTFPNTFALDIVTADGVAYGVVARDASGKLVLFSFESNHLGNRRRRATVQGNYESNYCNCRWSCNGVSCGSSYSRS